MERLEEKEEKGTSTMIRKESSLLDRMGELWTTRQMATDHSREIEVQITLRELMVYFMFLTLLLILSLGMTGTTMFFYTKKIMQLFVDMASEKGGGTTFRTSVMKNDFWEYVENEMINGFYWDTWYIRNTNKKGVQIYVNEDDRKIMYQNKMLGLPRLRQLRVRPDSCIIDSHFTDDIKKCYDFFSMSTEDRAPFGKVGGNMSGPAWTYQTEEELGGISYQGRLSNYPGGGYVKDLSLDRDETLAILQDLKNNLWLDRGTRVIFIDFTLYNANINLFCIVKLVMEFPPAGGLVTSHSIIPAKLLRYVTPFDYFVLACELIFFGFTLFYTFEEFREMFYYKRRYFYNKWNCLDLLILSISYVCIGFSIYRHIAVKARLAHLVEGKNHHEDFSALGYWQVQYTNWVGVCSFFSWIKIFKYISFNKTMTQLSNTLARCARDVAGFAIMFFIVFCAFAQFGYLLFGRQVEAFSSFSHAVFTLLRTILGDFDYESIERSSRILGPVFFLMYIFFVFFVLLNMFLAIINDTYSEVKTEIEVKREEFDVKDLIFRGVANIKAKLFKKKEEVKAVKVVDGSIDVEDIREALRRSNFLDLEIEMFFTKYDVDKHNRLSAKEVDRMMQDLGLTDGQPNDPSAKQAAQRIAEDYIKLEQRMRQVQEMVQASVETCNIIVDKLENRPFTKNLTKIRRKRSS